MLHRVVIPWSVYIALSSALAGAQIPEIEPTRSGFEVAPGDAARRRPDELARERARDLDAWLEANPTVRAHITTDRPLYRPGDSVLFKLWAVQTRQMAPLPGGALQVQLIDPLGAVAQHTTVDVLTGGGDASFTLDKAVAGGAWQLRAVLPDGGTVDRMIVVNTFESPRIKKTLEFAAESYKPGDVAEAAVTLARATGEPLARAAVTARVVIGGEALPPMAATTDARGEVVLRVPLPGRLIDPEALLTVLVDDAGVTESISRAIPIQLDDVTLGLYPEGGDLVQGLESRVYFEVTNAAGAPVDLRFALYDDRGHRVADAATRAEGRGHFTFTPEPGRAYHARTDDGAVDLPLPAALPDGCVMRHFDDLDGVQTAVRVRVACTSPRDVTVLATQHEQVFDRATVRVSRSTTVHLRTAVPALARSQGVARVTVFDDQQQPIAERLVLRNRTRGMRVEITPDKASYNPQDPVALRVRTTDADGRPVSAQVALGVVDDTLLAFADDHAHSLASDLLLQADLPEPIEGAADWLRPDHADGGVAADLALGTRGWRRFDWSQIAGFYQDSITLDAMRGLGYLGYADDEDRFFRARGEGAMAAGIPMAEEAEVQAVMKADAPRRVATKDEAPAPPATPATPARQFAPTRPQVTPRTDFRDTVLWKPAVLTGSDGAATVRFKLNDAVTSFRARADALGAGGVGSGEALIKSTLPFHVEARLPVALSTGDHLDVPLTLENQRSTSLTVALGAQAGDLLALGALPGPITLAPGARQTAWVGVDARPGYGAVDLTFAADAVGAHDGLTRTLPVVPRGVPQRWTAAGRLEGPVTHEVVIPDTALTGSISGQLTLLPSPVAEVLTGIEQMVRTPGGCFEQTSSTNWPNVVVLDLLERAGASGKLQVDRKQVLDAGYRILTGYQVGTGGFETWGSGPGKEALTAYGLLEFHDMDRVYDVRPGLLAESAQYLLDQRTGDGGYKVTGASAHGYGTAPPEVLDAYITYALVETGHTDLPKELDKSAALARTTRDPYRLGLATLTLLKARPAEGKAAAARLATLQAANGSFPGSETSITRSEHYNLDVEATALAAMALMRAGDVRRAQDAVSWLHDNQRGPGQWGATQGNALALRAIGLAAELGTKGDAPGQLQVRVDGELVAQATVEAGGRDPIPFDLGAFLSVGHHTVDVRLDGQSMPYALEAGWTTELPPSDQDRRVDLAVTLGADRVALGQTTRVTASLTNRTRDVVPDPIARIGLPAGLEAQTWQLEALKKQGEIAFFELRPREVTVYWDGLGVGEQHVVALDLVATAAGRFTAPASSAYPYYDDQAKAWVAGPKVEITR